MQSYPREEVRAAVDAFVDYRRQLDRGEAEWGGVARFFTDDAVYIDPGWGRVEGRDAIEKMFTHAMTGLEGWTYPVEFTAIEGNYVLVKWLQVVPEKFPDGRPVQHSGVSTMIYAGNGLFCYNEDLLNIAHIAEDIAAIGWMPGEGYEMPPANPDRSFAHPLRPAPSS
jgi:ketosteroid isomerase-like protein